MHSLKTTCVGQVFALAKPHHDSVGKRTRNRIPKEERKTLVESFIKKHQSLNNGSFPSLSLTHKEVGGSFYTIREIVREIIQENRVLGTAGLILDGKDDDHLQDQTLSSSVLMDHPVPPLSLSPHSPSDSGFDVLKDMEVNGYQLSEEDAGLLTHEPVKHDAELLDRVQTVCDSFASKPQGKELEVDQKDIGFEETPFIESNGTRVNDDGAAMTKTANMTENTLGTVDLPEEAVLVETFPTRSVSSTMESLDVQPSEVAKVCEGGKETEAVDLREISSSISVVPGEQGTEVINGQMPNQISVAIKNKVEEKTVNPASVDVESAGTKETVVANAVIGNIHETKEFSNGSLTTPTSGTESGSFKNDIARSTEVTSVVETTAEKGKLNASESSTSQKGNTATLNRIKPESWKGQSNGAGHEANPLLAVLKSFLTAFVKFWSE